MLIPSIFKNEIMDDCLFRNEFMNEFFDSDVRFPFIIPEMPKPLHAMKTDVREMGDHFELDIEMPGYKKEEIKAELKDGLLVVSAKKSEDVERKDDKGNFVRRERFFGTCKRSFIVGKDMKEEDIKADFTDGVLHISVPKKEEKAAIEDKKYIAIE